MLTLEIACNSFISCLHAEQGGAQRIELFENLHEGGCTPSYGIIKHVKEKIKLPVYVMIRARGGNFVYTNDELEIMIHDVRICRELGVNGIVFGALHENGIVNEEVCRRILQAWNHGPATFHRAIDESNILLDAAETIINLGFERILTSGGKSNAWEGMEAIAKLQNELGNRIEIQAGAGITSENAAAIVAKTGVRSIHATCKMNLSELITNQSMDINPTQITSLEKVKALRKVLDQI